MIESERTTTSVRPLTREGNPNGVTKNGAAPQPEAESEEYAYVFAYREPSSYSHVVDLARQYISPGTIVDLGAGAGSIGEPLRDAGFTYIAAEKHPGALRLLDARDIRNYAVDLSDTVALGAILDEVPDTQAFCLIDVLEHLHEPEPLLRYLSAYGRAHHAPYLLISVPNVAHRDVALNLLRGQWNVTEYGLLDKTHVAYYTRQSLLHLLERCGWQLVVCNDFALDESDQYDPESLLHTDSLIGEVLRYTGEIFNPDSAVNQFIWLLKPTIEVDGPGDAVVAADPETVDPPLVSVLIRTQGTRNELFTEALFSVFAQDCDNYEVVVCFHNPQDTDGSLLEGVKHVISTVPVQLRRAIRIIVSTGAGRSAPLNQLFEEARGEYLTILDDDDLLFPRHISTIEKGVERYGIGPMFQSFAVQRQLDVDNRETHPPEFGFKRDTALDLKRTTQTYPYTVREIDPLWTKPFDPLKQQYANSVHVSNFIVPRRLIEQSSLRFRNDFEYGEDWQFWMEASQILKVVTLPEITGVQNVRTNGTNTVGNLDLQPEWISMHKRRFVVQEEHPLILEGSASRLIYQQHRDELAKVARVEDYATHVRHSFEALEKEYWKLEREYLKVQDARHENLKMRGAYEELEREYLRQTAWAKDLERQLQGRSGLIRRILRRVSRK
jgi:hypothetical protein